MSPTELSPNEMYKNKTSEIKDNKAFKLLNLFF